MNSSEAEAVSGSDAAANPFFSADGKWVGFFASGKLKRVAVAGGVVETVCDASSSNLGGSWGADDTIYFAVSSGISKVSAAGGKPEVVTTLDRSKGEVSHRWPQVLPGGKALLLTVWTGPGWDETQLQLLDLKSGNRHLVVPGARTGYYAASGHLVYFRQGVDALMSVPFDLDRLQVGSGPPITLTERVRDTSEGGEYSLSNSGSLAYISSTPRMYESRLVWVNRDGTSEPLPSRSQAYMEPVLSPDGKQFAISVAGPAYTISIYDFDREALTLLRANGSSQAPQWTAQGRRIIYRGTRKGSRNLYERNADGSDDEKQLTTGEVTQTPTSISSDGSRVTFDMGGDVWLLTLDSNLKSAPILKTSFREANAHQSPDGRWLAYVSDESGINEIYVRPQGTTNGKWKISADGGTEPVWSRDSRELFYRAGDKMMAATISTGPAFSASVPKVIFTGQYQFSGTGVSGYDVSLDGRRFLMVQQTEAAQPAKQIDIVLNWIEQLRGVPVK
jgi:serine/threonine-protein kinase